MNTPRIYDLGQSPHADYSMLRVQLLKGIDKYNTSVTKNKVIPNLIDCLFTLILNSRRSIGSSLHVTMRALEFLTGHMIYNLVYT